MMAHKRPSILQSFERDDLTNWGELYVGFYACCHTEN